MKTKLIFTIVSLLSMLNLRSQSYEQLADSAQQALVDDYSYTVTGGYFFDQSTSPSNTYFHYWWNGYALEVLVDRYERATSGTQRDTAVELMKDLVNGMETANETFNNNYGHYNNFYDDMEWLAISSFRAFEAIKGTHPSDSSLFLDVSTTLLEDIKTGENDIMGGGIAWRKSQRDYKNNAANSPTVIVAARRYQYLGDAEDIALARRLYSWVKSNLVASSGRVYDGVNRDPKNAPGEIDLWEFTYGHGTFIGAALEMYRATDSTHYLDDAILTADYAVGESNNLLNDGIYKSEGASGDAPLFKGILIRYLTELAMETSVSSIKRDTYKAMVAENASALVSGGLNPVNYHTGPYWGESTCDAVLSAQLAGITLLEMAVKLGLISHDDGFLIPGGINAENYTSATGVSVEENGDADPYCGMNITSFDAPDDISYKVRVTSTDTYLVRVRAASVNSGRQLTISSNGNALATIDIDNTGDAQTYSTVTGMINLTAGVDTLLTLSAPNGSFNLNWIRFENPLVLTSEKIEAENFVEMSGVGTSGTSDFGGGETVDAVGSGDWMEYYVDVKKSREYNFLVRASRQPVGSDTLQLKSGATLIQEIAIPSTGGWENWATQSTTATLTAGAQILRLESKHGNANINWFKLDSIKSVVSGQIEAEDYQSMSGVVTETTTDTGGGQNVGGIDAGEWMDYELSVESDGWYKLDARIASIYAGRSFQLKKSADVLATVNIPNTGGWQNFQTETAYVQLTAGVQTLRIHAVDGGFNINWFELTFIPKFVRTIQAEDFISAHAGVGTETNCDIGSGLSLAGIDANEWAEYLVYADSTTDYMFVARVSSELSGKSLTVEVDGTPVETIDVPNTGNWQFYESISTILNISEGGHTIRISSSTGGFNLNWLKFFRAFSLTDARLEAENAHTEHSEQSGTGCPTFNGSSPYQTEIYGEESEDNLGTKQLSMQTGSWLDYYVYVPTTATYLFSARVSRDNALSGQGVLQLVEDGSTLVTLTIDGTGTWSDFVTLYDQISLSQGPHLLRVNAQTGIFNLNWIRFDKAVVVGDYVKIEAENSNSEAGVFVDQRSDNGIVYTSNDIGVGDHMDYFLDIDNAGQYLFKARVSNSHISNDAEMMIKDANSSTLYDSISISSNTGWHDLDAVIDFPSAGNTMLQLLGNEGEFHMNWFELLYDITDGGGTISDEHDDSPSGEEIDKVIDNSSLTKYLTTHAEGYIEYQTSEGHRVTTYSITSANDAEDRDPKDWKLQGHNGTSWVDLDTQTNQDFSDRYQRRFFYIDNDNSYKRYRLDITANNGSSLLQLAEWQLFGVEESCVSCRETLEDQKGHVEKLSPAEVQIYPNPISAGDQLIVHTYKDDGIREIELIDLSGQQIQRSSYHELPNDVEVSIGRSVKGIYLLKVSATNGTFVTRVIIR